MVALAVADCLFFWLSWIGSIFIFTYLFVLDQRELISAVNSGLWVIVLACVLFYVIFGVYRNLWLHPGVGGVIRVTTAVLVASFSVYVYLRLSLGWWPNPGLGVLAFYFQLTLSLMLRLYKTVWDTLFYYFRRSAKEKKLISGESVRTLLVGAGDTASDFIRRPSRQGARERKIIGLVDNNRRKHGFTMHGVPIFGGDEAIPRLVKTHDIDELVIAVPSMKNDDLRRIVKLTPANRCKVRILSGLVTESSPDMLRELNISDLLGRPETACNKQVLNSWLKDKTVLVTGGGGSIGSEICRLLINLNVKKIIVYDISENNAYNLKEELKVNFGDAGQYKVAVRIGSVQDSSRLDEVFSEFSPSVVFHAAAYKHVPLMEECPRLAFENNFLGTYRTAKVAISHNVERFVMVSTDKAVNPTNVMGATKRLAELVTLGMNQKGRTEFVCVRFGNVLDSNGSVIPLFKRQIEAGGPITITHPDIIRYFMTITEASGLVLEAGAMANGGEIFILDMGEPVKIVDLAESLVRMAGLTPEADIKFEYIGLRPGEKLYEELLLNEEGLKKTLNDKIFVVDSPPYSLFDELVSTIEEGFSSDDDIIARIKYFVSEYECAEDAKH
jgi:FlaA1/EpsC-like NDP-sugar epimerase